MSSLYNLKIRYDVLNSSLDSYLAPELSEIVLNNPKVPDIYRDPAKFFSITYLTDTMEKLINEVISTFKNGTYGKTILLYSFFGGGKTHTLIFLYHLFKFPNVAKEYRFDVPNNVKVVVIGGRDSNTAPSPLDKLQVGDTTIQTLWGYIAYSLNKYDLIKDLDESLTSPEAERIRKIIGEDKVLIIIDEIAFYLSRIATSPYTEYYRQCLNFFELLAQLTNSLPVVLIISLPAQYAPDLKDIISEKGYEDVVGALYRRVKRVAVNFWSPVSSDVDLVNVLKKRIFEDVNPPIDLIQQYEKNIEKFKDKLNEDEIKKLASYYPFHPYYIRVLENLLKYNESLQKNRDAIRITRMVVRNLWKERPHRDLILPSDIDLRKQEFQNLLLKDFSMFKGPLDEMIRKTKGLAVNFYIANYIFLSTYIYKLGLAPNEYNSLLPTDKDVATALYDLAFLNSSNLTPEDVIKKLDDLTKGGSLDKGEVVPFLIEKDNRYWFTFWADPRKLCSNEAKGISDLDVLNKFKEITKDLALKGIGKQRQGPEILKLGDVIDNLDNLLLDDDKGYKLYISISPISEFDLESKATEFIFYKASGNSKAPRRYANSTVVLLSDNTQLRDEIQSYIKEWLGCNRVDISKYWSKEDNVVRDLAKKYIEDYKNYLDGEIRNKLLQYYTKIAYPIDSNKINITDLSSVSNQRVLAVDVEETLVNNKILKTINFDTLKYYFNDVLGIKDISNNNQRKVSDIIEMFYVNPKLPFVKEDDIINAIKEGVENLEIGVMINGRVYFKKIENSDFSVTPDAIILNPEHAAELQINDLINEGKEIQEGDKVIKEYWVLVNDYEQEIELSELKNDPNKLDKLRLGKLTKKRREVEKGVEIQVEPNEIEGEIGEIKKVKLKVYKIGSYEGKVSVESDIFGRKEIEPNFEEEIPVTIDQDKEIRFTLHYDNRVKYSTLRVVVKKRENVIEVPPKQIPQQGSIQLIEISLEGVKGNSMLSIIQDLKRIVGKKTITSEFTIDNKKDKIGNFKIINNDTMNFISFLQNELPLFGSDSEIRGRITIYVEGNQISQSDREVIDKLLRKDKPDNFSIIFKIMVM
ncbi:DUF499 domain-containing protein [Sulfolobus sp. E11-6]|uniref:DUF499 domain-containing protein n=1 Tax=Sulfolobus sp. E11-6 TaxID=2663020 RepID=UPI001296F8B3|nr:DUF499 domain-containing protein [Sulfolobus sp. E11-6]QGA69061.1 DUF499 domain-containing protein [Sulfolobus sp. E11-6]